MLEYKDLLERCDITDEDCSKEVTEKHLDKICSFLCVNWRQLPSYLEMKANVVTTVDCEQVKEAEKKRMFFLEWCQKKGPDATYKALIIALLEKEHVKDAANVCKLLQKKDQDSSEPCLQSHCYSSVVLWVQLSYGGVSKGKHIKFSTQ